MNLTQIIYYSAKTIYMMSIGWLFHPEDYERYYTAWRLVREHPDYVHNTLLT
jgi:hypothetical protein